MDSDMMAETSLKQRAADGPAPSRRGFLGMLAGASLASAQVSATKRPNIVILLADDLGFSDVGYHGSEIRTPNIDRLAKEGLRLERAYSCPVCSPTRSALMTGRVAMRLGLGYTVIRPWSNFGVSLEERFLPQAFHDAGYQTAISGKWHLGHGDARYLPHARGFDQAYGHVNGAIDYFTHEREGGLDWHRNGKSVVEEGYSTTLLGNEAVRFIERRDRNRPFLLYVPFNAPHSPLQAPAEVLKRYANIQDSKRRAYAAMVDVMDEQIGRILGSLDKEKLANDTIVLFFSDNGGPINLGATNTPLRNGKATTFEGGIRVPAVIRWSGVLKPGISQQVLYTADYFPTLAAAARVEPGNKLPMDGKNLWPELKSGQRRVREDLFFSVESGGMMRYAVLRREWKVVREVNSSTNKATDYLFRIEDDPSEKTNLAEREPKLVAELGEVIDKWRALHPANGQRLSGGPPAGWKVPERWAESARGGR